MARSHPPARVEAVAAQAAARAPQGDEEAQGKAANAEKMHEAKPKEFDQGAFIRAVEQAIAEKAPRNLDQADKFADSGKADEVRDQVQGSVGAGKQASAQEIASTTAAPPDTAAAVTKTVVPLTADRPPGTPGAPDPRGAVPDKLPASATDMSAGPAQVTGEMADAQVTEAQLRRSNEPSFAKALGAKKSAERHSEVAPGRLRKHEAGELRAGTAQAQQTGTAAMGAIGAERVVTGQRVGAGKTGAKSRDEEKRAQVTTLLQGVFDTMKQDVEAILTGLDKRVDDKFGRGEKQARDWFTREHRQKMDEYKDRRYSGRWGLIRWGKDKLLGLPAEADRIFDRARDGYLLRMRQVITDVAGTIGSELDRAKRRIAQGRTELQTAVKKLPADLQTIGREAAAEFEGKFDELTQSVDDKGTQLVDTLATKYTEALKAVDDEIAAEREKNQGLVDKAVNAVKSVINTILELKRLLLGVLAKAASAVMLILKDPIGFLRNLAHAVGAGLRLFLRNIGRHLQQGIMSWLLGRATEAGLQLPARFDTRGVFTMLASLLGLTWPAIRARLTRRVPEQAVAAAETAVPLVAEVRRRGVAGMWDDLRHRVGDLRKNLIDKVIQYVTPTIITAGITWILSLLNPASAFVRAVKLIIDIVTFIVTQARQIIAFVNAVLDSVIAIAKGATAGVPAMIERALARSIPVLLGALAALLGVGGIASRVKTIVQAMTRPVNRAIDHVIDKAVGLVKRLWARTKSTFDRKGSRSGKSTYPKGLRKSQPSEHRSRRIGRNDQKKPSRLSAEPSDKNNLPNKVTGLLRKKAFSLPEEKHTLTAKGDEDRIVILIASSNAGDIDAILIRAISAAEKNMPEARKNGIISVLRSALTAADLNLFKQEFSKLSGHKRTRAGSYRSLGSFTRARANMQDYIDVRLAEIAREITSLRGLGINSLQEVMAQKVPKERGLPQSIDVRSALYLRGSGWERVKKSVIKEDKAALGIELDKVNKLTDRTKAIEILTRLAKEGVLPDTATQTYLSAGKFLISDIRGVKYQVDHMDSLAQHWVDIGHDSGDGARWTRATDRKNLRWVTQRYNLSKGSQNSAGERATYASKFWVGPEFVSIFAEGGIKNAKKINSVPFIQMP
ncbi:hypothetical protein [Streptomyces sp. NPDC020965]|uniref:hypothetical protein n=1 Tax=Streptomyces sp. NPDC020965 TaxID=3365105 RepID=UPI00379F5661